MDDLEKLGHDRIEQAVAACKGNSVMVIEMLRQFGDILHSTVVVRHYRKTTNHHIVWAIDERFVPVFADFTPQELGPHAIAALPQLPAYPTDGPYRIAWVEAAKKLPGVASAFGCGVHPWGWERGDIVSAVFNNAGISSLAVPRRPWVPVSVEDVQWAREFVSRQGISRHVALEYVSYSLGSRPLSWYQEFVKRVHVPVLALGSKSDPHLPGAVDARGTTFQQAKALIAHAKVFVGCGSGLSVLAAANGCEQPTIELIDQPLSMTGIGYRRLGDRHWCMPAKSPKGVADQVNKILTRTHL